MSDSDGIQNLEPAVTPSSAAPPDNAAPVAAPSELQLSLFAKDAIAPGNGRKARPKSRRKSPSAPAPASPNLDMADLQTQMQHQQERIQELELALDETVATAENLRSQLVQQAFLEEQLAATETIANIQQRAIHQLKQQLGLLTATDGPDETAGDLSDEPPTDVLTMLESLTTAQQLELEQLRQQIDRGQADLQQQRNEWEAERRQLQNAIARQQAQIKDLDDQLATLEESRQPLIERFTELAAVVQELAQTEVPAPLRELLEQRCHKLREVLGLGQEAPEADATPPKPRPISIGTLEKELAIAHTKIGELETEIAKQMTTQAMLHHGYRELEAERDRQHAGLLELQTQHAEMQEQILHQVQQAKEYEMAVQHWKDRYVNSYSQVHRLQELLAAALPDLPDEVQTILEQLQATTTTSAELDSAVPVTSPLLNRDDQLDLPDFLMRRRKYKTRRTS